MVARKRTGPYTVSGFTFWVQDCTIWYDSDGNGTVETNVDWATFKAEPAISQTVKNQVEVILDGLGCKTP